MVRFDERYFEEQYANYEAQNPQRKLRWYASLLRQFISESAPATICDIGCGGAAFIRSLPPLWSRFGIDPAGGVLKKVLKRDTTVPLCCGSLEHLPLKGTFDAVTLFDVLEHVPALDAAAVQLDSLLAPGAVLLFVVPVYDGPLGPIVRLLDHDPTHVHCMSRRWWLNWVHHHFDVQRWYGVGRYYFAHRYYIHLPTRLLRSIAPAIAVVVKKKNLPMP